MIADRFAASGLEEILLGRNRRRRRLGARAHPARLEPAPPQPDVERRARRRCVRVCERARRLRREAHALNLGHNKIGDLGVAALAAAVRANANLGKLDVGVNLASRQRTDVLRAAMAPEAPRRRRLSAFRAAARVVLAAYNRDVRGGVAPDPPRLGCLPFALVLVVLKHACLAWGGPTRWLSSRRGDSRRDCKVY